MQLFYPADHPVKFKYTPEATALGLKLHRAIQPIMEEAFKQGASPRELEYIAGWEARDIALDMIIQWGSDTSVE